MSTAMPFSPKEALQRVIEHREIFHEEMVSLMRQIMRGEVSPVMIAGILIGLRVKKETIGEIAGAAEVMREFATKVPIPAAAAADLLDIVGTGGDGAHTFNISTTVMFVTAAAGAKVAKHGGRSVSSQSGSADAIEALGVKLDLSPEQVARCIDQTGIGFMFAPSHHSAMKHAAPVRKELGVRTLFNILGPLTNPANAGTQLLGVFHPDLVGILVRVLQRLGSRRALVVHGVDGLDEVSLAGPTLVGELKDGEVREYQIKPDDFGITPAPISALQVANPNESIARMKAVLANEPGPSLDIVLLNAGAALYAAGHVDSIAEGIGQARAAIASGAALNKLNEFVACTQTV